MSVLYQSGLVVSDPPGGGSGSQETISIGEIGGALLCAAQASTEMEEVSRGWQKGVPQVNGKVKATESFTKSLALLGANFLQIIKQPRHLQCR